MPPPPTAAISPPLALTVTVPDFRRLQALIAAKCRTCGAERLVDPLPMLTSLIGQHGAAFWRGLAQITPCPCGSVDLRLRTVPFAARQKGETTARGAWEPARQRLVTLALGVLDAAAYRWRTDFADTIEVRLALTVLGGILADRACLKRYWAHAGTRYTREADAWCQPTRTAYYAIAATLREEGWAAPV